MFIAGGYLLGSIPTGYLVVRLRTGKDIRAEHSGRTGGTNVMRATGLSAGVFTAVADVAKAAAAVWLVQAVLPQAYWLHVLVGLAAVLGHNYSLFLLRREDGQLAFSGGAGGSPTVGAAIGLWPVVGLIIVPVGALVLYFVGYASVATMTIGVVAFLVFSARALAGVSPWSYAVFAVIAELLLLWALRPNIRRLLQGEERIVGRRAKAHDGAEQKATS